MAAVNESVHAGAPDVDEPAWRTLEYFALTRALIASALVLSVVALGPGPSGWHATPVAIGSLVYFVLAAGLAVIVIYVRQRFLAQVAAQIAVDLIIISSLLWLGGGSRTGVTILYLLPLAGASLLLPTVAVFFVCALAVFALLSDAVFRLMRFEGADATVVQAGLYGAALFAVAALLRFLASRLAAQERLAQSRGRMIENQLEINRLVIAQMEQGAVVIDALTRVRANNRAARILLGLGPDAQLTGRRLTEFPALAPLSTAFQRWTAEVARTGGGHTEAAVSLPDLRLRARFVRPQTAATDEFAIFLEDVRQVEERAQQLKLAAMGRLTASIAHEIRNPLGAIGHAAQLLNEDIQEPTARRLVAIVRENTQRLNRLVDDVLRAARRDPPLGDDIDLPAFLAAWLSEFVRDRGLDAAVIRLDVAPALRVRFEESHLRQVLYNLLDNAVRFASRTPGSVTVLAERGEDARTSALLWIFDDGPGVSADIGASVFEPFFTTGARGTGLGLYMAREFCVVNRAELGYGVRRAGGSERPGFVIRFGQGAARQLDAADFLDTMPAS
ncbi:MAG: two-component system sensor histidine kinase NtrB [Gemmatimonadota bacterium]